MDPEFPTVDLRNALDSGLVPGPRLIVAAHIISASAGHGDLRVFYAPRWDLPLSAIADGIQEIRRLVRREHAYGSDWIKTANAGGYFSVGDDPARPTWFDDEMEAVCSTAQLLGMPVAVHTGAAQACKQAIRYGARSLEHAYLIDEEAVEMATRGGSYVVPTMQMTQEDLAELQAGTLPCQAVWKFSRDNRAIIDAQQLLASSDAKVAFGTDCGMFPFSHGIREFQAMVDAGLSAIRALRAGTSVAAELLGRNDIGVLKPGACADIVSMPGNPTEDIAARRARHLRSVARQPPETTATTFAWAGSAAARGRAVCARYRDRRRDPGSPSDGVAPWASRPAVRALLPRARGTAQPTRSPHCRPGRSPACPGEATATRSPHCRPGRSPACPGEATATRPRAPPCRPRQVRCVWPRCPSPAPRPRLRYPSTAT
jgi:imidazolonepropionase-like amidohydrolase